MENASTPGRESAKQRSRRIPLDYYRHATRLTTVKWLLTFVAAIVGGGYCTLLVAGWLLGVESSASHWSPGPVAGRHAAWDGQCATCHVRGANQRSDGGAIGFVSAPFAGEAWRRETADDRCIDCHAGPAHHDNQLAKDVVSCATCHRDHQGRDADLARVSDSLCASCHADLAQHQDQNKMSLAAGKLFENTASWMDHPDFRSIGGSGQATFSDPGKLRFNHALHLSEGQVAPGAENKVKQTWGTIPEPYQRQLLAGRPTPAGGSFVTLVCASCHQLDDKATGQLPAQGAYMQPIMYERHCAGCHYDDLRIDDDQAIGNQQMNSSLAELPHALRPGEIRAVIAGMLRPLPEAKPLSPSRPLQLIPGKTPGENLAQRIDDDLARRLAAAEMRLLERHRCGKCHAFEDHGTSGLMPAVQPTAVPTVWLQHARFDHSAHRAMQCFDCHEQTQFAWSDETKVTRLGTSPVIPNRQVCLKCHRPTTASGAAGARFDCVECHRYHGGDLGPHGVGAPQRGVPPDRSRNLLERMTGQGASEESFSPSAGR